MKKITLILLIGVILLSCNKDDDETVTEINIDILNTENYEYNVGSFGIEDGARINIQAEHYEISELNRDTVSQIIYMYKPQIGYVGSDFVEIRTARGSDGSNEGSNIDYVKITFEVTE